MSKLDLRQFNVREAEWESEAAVISNIRRLVFIIEQQVPKDDEWDGRDEESWHFLATDENDEPIGTARLLPDGQIGRMAVLEKYRGRGIGRVLLEQAVDKARHLSMKEVFLHAQTHALPFYEKAGFETHGDEFKEAGIAHKKMVMQLPPLGDNVQRRQAVDTDVEWEIKPFDTSEVNWDSQGKQIRVIRQNVLVRELGLPASVIEDDVDASAIHWVAQDDTGQCVGCIRMTIDGEISCLAVLPEHRNNSIEHSLIDLAVSKAQRFELDEIHAVALGKASDLFRDAGFEASGDVSSEHDVNRQEFTKHLERDFEIPSAHELIGTEVSDVVYSLGEDNQYILLRREEDFRNVILEMCCQARHSIRIYSPVLNHKLFHNEEFKQICSAFARRNKYTFIDVLLYDSHRVVKNSHALLEISRKLSSSIRFKIVHPELRQQNHEYFMVDEISLIYRLDHETYEGYANFREVTDSSRLTRQFVRAWESGLNDPNLRTLRI